MSKPKESRRAKSETLFSRADKKWDGGDLRAAFRLFLASAKMGNKASQLNVGNCFADGTGTRRNIAAALYWYRLAYRRGDASAANNIGIVWRDENQPERALRWFERSVKLGNDSSNLEIAKHYLANKTDHQAAIPYLQRVCQSDWVSEADAEEARRLLKEVRRGVR